MQFFGRQVSDTGCEVLVKVGSRFADPANAGHLVSWRDGQIIQIMPLGFHLGKQVGYCCTLLRFPNIDYATIGGKWEEEWGKAIVEASLRDRILYTTNADGKYSWEVMTNTEFKSTRKTRDYFLDFKDLENEGLITPSNREMVYDYSNKTIITISSVFDLESLIKHEEVDTRLDPDKLLQHASITSGVHSIGSGLDYDTVDAFEAAIGTPLTGNLTGEHNAEQTATSALITFDTETATYLLKLTAQSGDEHNGGAYGNGARISFAASSGLSFDETTAGHMADIEVSKLAFLGANNVLALNAFDCTNIKFNRNLIDGNGATNVKGINHGGTGCLNFTCINTIVYDCAGAAYGIKINSGTTTVYVCNNTIINTITGIRQDHATVATNTTVKNNLVQACTNDFVDDGAGFGTTSKNISEDATSPDVSYRSKDVHTNSVFIDYANDDFRIDKDGDSTNLAIIDDGEDLSGVFTDDVANDAGRRSDPFDIGASQRDAESTTVAPTTAAPTTLSPTTLPPTTITPTTLAPTTAEPTTLAPTTVAPTTLPPTTLAPTTIAPTTAEPTTIAPTTPEPTTVTPTTLPPTTLPPTTTVPTTLPPTTIIPTTLGPTTIGPTTLPPTTLAPTTSEPTTLAPTTLPPTTVVPTTLAPTTAAPTTLAPTTLAPTSLAPTTVSPTTLVPTTAAPTTAVPTTVAPTTLAPTTLAPTSLAPTTIAPTTAVPTTILPTTLAPTTLTLTTLAPTTAIPVVVCVKSFTAPIIDNMLLNSYITKEIPQESYITKEMMIHGNLC